MWQSQNVDNSKCSTLNVEHGNDKILIMLITGEIYHLLNRGTEDRVIFKDRRDYERFLITIFECNDINSLPENKQNRHRRCENRIFSQEPNKPLVEILCLCLMPNHFHIAVKQAVDGGISKFMQKLGNSYTKYFNIKNNRKGSLFMSRYKSVHVGKDSQFEHLISYIHANPLDLVMPEWREGKIKNPNKARNFLENYVWSSYPFYENGKILELIRQIIKPKMVNAFYPKKGDHFDYISSWSARCSTLNVEQGGFE